MTIDYDRLREDLEDFDQAETFHAKVVALEAIRVNAVSTANELLRLRDGIEVIRDYCAGVTTARRSSGDPATAVIARELGAVDRALADLLNGDTK